MPLTNTYEKLCMHLLSQPFLSPLINNQVILADCIKAVTAYVEIEKCLAVLSDLKANKSYIFPGTIGKLFDLATEPFEIESAFEDDIFNKINIDDLAERHKLELEYLHLQIQTPIAERFKYTTLCRLRLESEDGSCSYINHRTMYLKSLEDGSIWLALCLYAPASQNSSMVGINAQILNNETGEVTHVASGNGIIKFRLSKREKELLQLVSAGLTSKEIAAQMGISLNTVNRHRQNLISKMKVNNLTEAVKAGLLQGLI